MAKLDQVELKFENGEYGDTNYRISVKVNGGLGDKVYKEIYDSISKIVSITDAIIETEKKLNVKK